MHVQSILRLLVVGQQKENVVFIPRAATLQLGKVYSLLSPHVSSCKTSWSPLTFLHICITLSAVENISCVSA